MFDCELERRRDEGKSENLHLSPPLYSYGKLFLPDKRELTNLVKLVY